MSKTSATMAPPEPANGVPDAAFFSAWWPAGEVGDYVVSPSPGVESRVFVCSLLAHPTMGEAWDAFRTSDDAGPLLAEAEEEASLSAKLPCPPLKVGFLSWEMVAEPEGHEGEADGYGPDAEPDWHWQLYRLEEQMYVHWGQAYPVWVLDLWDDWAPVVAAGNGEGE